MESKEVSEWKNKYEASERNLQSLKKMAHVAVADYEDLQRKYDQNQKQYEDLKRTLIAREEQIQELQTLIEPAVDQYNELNMKFEIERGCRNEAENYAGKVFRENTKLKRQSQMLLDKMTAVEISIEDLGGIMEATENSKEGEEIQKHCQQLSKTIEVLQDKVAELQTKLNRAEEARDDALEKENVTHERFEKERESHRRTQDSLAQHETSLKQFKRVSTRAFDEYQDIKDRYQKEKVLKETAEGYAHQMLTEKNTIARESSVLIASAASHEQLRNALMEIETLMKTMGEERQAHKLQVEQLEAEILTSKDLTRISELETMLEDATEQIEQLQKQSKDVEQWKAKMIKENEQLTNDLDVANQKLHPPPPPAPPLPPGGFLNPLRLIMKKPKPQPVQQADPNKDKFKGAIQEMMERIRTGQTLRPMNKHRRPSLPDFPSPKEVEPEEKLDRESAMQEMHKMLTSIKRTAPTAEDLEPIPVSQCDGAETDLMRTFNKIRKGTPSHLHLSLIPEEKEGASRSSSGHNGTTGTNSQDLQSQDSNTSTSL